MFDADIRLGRNEIKHCYTLTYDLAQSEIRLSCAEQPF